MKSVLAGAVNYLFGLFLRVSPIKFIVSVALFALLQLLMQVVFDFLPNWIKMDGIFAYLTPGMWWFLDLANFSLGFPLIVNAYVTRFLIRRIPFVG